MGVSPLLRETLYAMGAGRTALGLAPFVAPELLSRRLGFPAAHDNPSARLLARLFGVRDIGLGVLAVWATADASRLPFMALFQAAADAGDILSASIPLLRRQGIDRAATATIGFASVGFVAWLSVWFVSR